MPHYSGFSKFVTIEIVLFGCTNNILTYFSFCITSFFNDFSFIPVHHYVVGRAKLFREFWPPHVWKLGR